jgi:hypothetical protein
MKKKVLFEDTISVYNKWVSGQASREFSAIKMKFNDLLGNDKHSMSQSPNDAKGQNVLPYPLPNTASILGDLLTGMSNAISTYKTALNNPLVKEDEKAKKELELIKGCLEKALTDIKQIFTVLTKSVDEDDVDEDA